MYGAPELEAAAAEVVEGGNQVQAAAAALVGWGAGGTLGWGACWETLELCGINR